MRRLGLLGAVVFIAAILLSSGVDASDGLDRLRAPDGWGPGSRYGRMFNPDTVATVTAKVVSRGTFTPPDGRYGGVHMKVATSTSAVDVHLGPEWFIANQGFELNPGDVLEVTGSRVTYEGKTAIIASRLRKGGAELLLRDENGIPYWHAYRRGPAR